jgi:cytochrome d ubiquinol oxidase subunit I
MLAIEFGWVYAEIGRQPWILRGYMKTSAGATTSENVGFVLLLFVSLYILLAFTSIKVLSKLFRNHPAEEELDKLALEARKEVRL